jgi:hypothetical protein
VPSGDAHERQRLRDAARSIALLKGLNFLVTGRDVLLATKKTCPSEEKFLHQAAVAVWKTSHVPIRFRIIKSESGFFKSTTKWFYGRSENVY